MIGRLRGLLVLKKPPFLVVELGGLGYDVQVPMSTIYQLPPIGSEVILLTHFYVREDLQVL
jgi:Holliday junction DNA helicase RuvA